MFLYQALNELGLITVPKPITRVSLCSCVCFGKIVFKPAVLGMPGATMGRY